MAKSFQYLVNHWVWAFGEPETVTQMHVIFPILLLSSCFCILRATLTHNSFHMTNRFILFLTKLRINDRAQWPSQRKSALQPYYYKIRGRTHFLSSPALAMRELCKGEKTFVQVIVNFIFGLCVLTTYNVGLLSHGTHWGETCLSFSKLLQPGWSNGGLVLISHCLLRVHHVKWNPTAIHVIHHTSPEVFTALETWW